MPAGMGCGATANLLNNYNGLSYVAVYNAQGRNNIRRPCRNVGQGNISLTRARHSFLLWQAWNPSVWACSAVVLVPFDRRSEIEHTCSMAVTVDVQKFQSSTVLMRNTSPMKPYCKGLRLIKACGLPLRITMMDDGSVKFEDHLRLFKCGIAMGKQGRPILPPIGFCSLHSHFRPSSFFWIIRCPHVYCKWNIINGWNDEDGCQVWFSK